MATVTNNFQTDCCASGSKITPTRPLCFQTSPSLKDISIFTRLAALPGYCPFFALIYLSHNSSRLYFFTSALLFLFTFILSERCSPKFLILEIVTLLLSPHVRGLLVLIFHFSLFFCLFILLVHFCFLTKSKSIPRKTCWELSFVIR